MEKNKWNVVNPVTDACRAVNNIFYLIWFAMKISNPAKNSAHTNTHIRAYNNNKGHEYWREWIEYEQSM